MNLYLIMGTHLPEIGACIDSLVEASAPDSGNQVLWPKGLEPVPESLAGITVEPFQPEALVDSLPVNDPGNVFLLLDPRLSLLDQIEELAQALREAALEPAKVITCVDAAMAEASPKLQGWLDASIFFSDIVLVGNRATASKPFLRNFEKRYQRKCYPCLFMFLKGPGRPVNPRAVLAPDARRISQVFDLPESPQDAPPGLIIEASCDLDADEEPSHLFPGEDSGKEEALALIPDIRDCLVTTP